MNFLSCYHEMTSNDLNVFELWISALLYLAWYVHKIGTSRCSTQNKTTLIHFSSKHTLTTIFVLVCEHFSLQSSTHLSWKDINFIWRGQLFWYLCCQGWCVVLRHWMTKGKNNKGSIKWKTAQKQEERNISIS